MMRQPATAREQNESESHARAFKASKAMKQSFRRPRLERLK
jgi:hypothetical protein